MRMATDEKIWLPGTGLLPSDYAKLAARWITQELADAAHVRRVSDVEAAEILGRKCHVGSNLAGIAIPYLEPADGHTREWRIRRDLPDLEAQPDGGVKELNKYLSPKGARNMIYFPPGVTPAQLMDTELQVAIVEGELKCLALHRLALHETDAPRWLAIGLQGVMNWRGRRGKTGGPNGERLDVKGVIADVDRVNFAGRKALIVFDSNVTSNPDVKSARTRLTRELKRRGARVYWVTVPEKPGVNGVDDWLSLDGPEAVLEAFSRAHYVEEIKAPADFKLIDTGVYLVGDALGLEPDQWICSRLEIVAAGRDRDNKGWCKVLRFWDADGRQHEWPMPMAMLAGDGSEYRAQLLDMGLQIAPGRNGREALAMYIQKADPEGRVRCVDRTGWTGNAFVLPDGVIGDTEEMVMYQAGNHDDHCYRVAGTLNNWREEIGQHCSGNPFLLFACSCGFAAPLLKLANTESGGFHLRSGSSAGKTTTLWVGGSVWGGGDSPFFKTWRATANGLEAVAVQHNDALLPLDEIAQLDPHQVGEIAYLLANEQGKNRMNRGIAARRPLRWRLLFLSTGEVSLADHASTAGKRLRAGAEVRVVNIECEGVFQNLHGFENADLLARHLSGAAHRYYGSPIRAFLDFIVGDLDNVATELPEYMEKFVTRNVTAGASGEVYRAARRFALVAAGGELATEAGITGWRLGEAEETASKLFESWRTWRGGDRALDEEAAIRQVRSFIERHGASQFQRMDANGERVFDRVGFRTDEGEGAVYYILPEAFRNEVCKGFDHRMVAKALASRGYLRIEGKDRLTVREKFPEIGRQRAYAVLAAVLEAMEDRTPEHAAHDTQ